MNAKSSNSFFHTNDGITLIEVLLSIDPKARTERSKCWRQVHQQLISLGWTPNRIGRTANQLKKMGMLYLSCSRNSVSLVPVVDSEWKIKKQKRKRKSGHCVYCGRHSKKLTKDHVVPRGQGGTSESSNLVMCCQSCNASKGNMTPEQWAKSILNYRRTESVYQNT